MMARLVCFFVFISFFSVVYSTSSSSHWDCKCTVAATNGNYCNQWVCDQSSSSSGQCFEASQTVRLEDGTTKPMSDINIGDRVEIVDAKGQLSYSGVFAWFDHDPNLRVNFLQLFYRSESGEEGSLTMTPEHLIYFVAQDADQLGAAPLDLSLGSGTQFAGSIQVGDKLWRRLKNGQLEKVTVSHIEQITSRGAYGPATEEGNLVVNDLLASCFAHVNHEASRYVLEPMRYAMQVKHWWNQGRVESTSDDSKVQGIHWYANALFNVFLKSGIAEKILPASLFYHP